MLQLGVVFQYKLITVISVLTDNDRVELFVSEKSKHVDINCHFCIFNDRSELFVLAKSKHVDISCHFCIFSGRGNSAFETATHIYGATNLIHMVARSRVRLSWATHYVGDLR